MASQHGVKIVFLRTDWSISHILLIGLFSVGSIEFHEKGKRHQENVQKRIHNIQKKGIKEAKKQQELEDTMAQIERAALSAYKKDLKNNVEACPNPEAVKKAATAINEFTPYYATPPKPTGKANKKGKKPKGGPKKLRKLWYEAVTDDGHKYYWNTETSESQWDPPKIGYISIEAQNNSQQASLAVKVKVEVDDSPASIATSGAIGPQPKAEPYGKWIKVEDSVPEEVDLQLPQFSEDKIEVNIPVFEEEQRPKFKEKVIGQLAVDSGEPGEEVAFKKRKLNSASKRNVRQRTNDD